MDKRLRGDNLVSSDKINDCFIFIHYEMSPSPPCFQVNDDDDVFFLTELCSIWSLIHKVRLFSNWTNWSSSFIKSKDKPSTYTKCLHHLSAKSEADILSTSLKAAFILQVFLCDGNFINGHTLNSLIETSGSYNFGNDIPFSQILEELGYFQFTVGHQLTPIVYR